MCIYCIIIANHLKQPSCPHAEISFSHHNIIDGRYNRWFRLKQNVNLAWKSLWFELIKPKSLNFLSKSFFVWVREKWMTSKIIIFELRWSHQSRNKNIISSIIDRWDTLWMTIAFFFIMRHFTFQNQFYHTNDSQNILLLAYSTLGAQFVWNWAEISKLQSVSLSFNHYNRKLASTQP